MKLSNFLPVDYRRTTYPLIVHEIPCKAQLRGGGAGPPDCGVPGGPTRRGRRLWHQPTQGAVDSQNMWFLAVLRIRSDSDFSAGYDRTLEMNVYFIENRSEKAVRKEN